MLKYMAMVSSKYYIPEYSSEYLSMSCRGLDAYENDLLHIAVIHGPQGYGKSTLAMQIAAEIEGYDFKTRTPGTNYKKALQDFVFTPTQFINKSNSTSGKKRVIVWDDAGFWISTADRYDAEVIAIGKYLEVARTDWATIIFTCTDLSQLFNRIRHMPSALSLKVTQQGKDKTHPHRRTAFTYRPWKSEDGSKGGRMLISIDIFQSRMPLYIYNQYVPFRDKFCSQGKYDWDEVLKLAKLKRYERQVSMKDRKQKLDKKTQEMDLS